MHDRLGVRTMLRDPTGGRISADERVEQATAAHIPDEYPHRRDPERVLVHDNIDRPRWCPGVLTRSQKGEFKGCIRQRHWRKRKEERLLGGESDLKFGVSSQRLMEDSHQNHWLHLLM